MQFIFSPILGSLSDQYGRRPILFFSIIGSAIGYLFIGFAFALWMVFAGRIISGITGGNISTAQAYIADATSKENRAKGMGLFGAMFGLGFVFGPAIGGILSRFGISVPFLFAAVLSAVNAILVYFILPETVNTANYDPHKVAQKPFCRNLRIARRSDIRHAQRRLLFSRHIVFDYDLRLRSYTPSNASATRRNKTVIFSPLSAF